MELLNNALHETAERMGFDKIVEAEKLVSQWEKIVGPQIAKNTRPLNIRNDRTLVVQTQSPVWSHQLAMVKTQILGKLKAAGYEIADLGFKAETIKKEEEKHEVKIEAKPDFKNIPAKLKPELRQAIASYTGALNELRREKEKTPATCDKISRQKEKEGSF